jgi:hypothetical protein
MSDNVAGVNVLGFSGKKQSGKNTAANCIVSACMQGVGYDCRIDETGRLMVYSDDIGGHGYLDMNSRRPEIMDFLNEEVWGMVKLYSFADPLKYFLIQVFGLTEEQCYGNDEQKNSFTELEWENMPTNTKKKGRMTAREVMQYFGTDICRRMLSNVWVDATLRQIRYERPAIAIITDIRFPNEVEGTQEAGGRVGRFTRAPFAGQDEHESETALDDYPTEKFDAIWDNTELTIAEQAEIIQNTMLEWGWIEDTQ